MKQLLMIGLAAGLSLLSCACQHSSGCRSEFEKAKSMIAFRQAECILMKNGKIVVVERGGGVSPLLAVYKKHRTEMNGGVIVDKVIGRAAACIAICGKARHVYGEVMSEDAVKFLKDNGITASHSILVPRILNRTRSGLCPLEKSVEGIQDPAKALSALEAKIASFSKK